MSGQSNKHITFVADEDTIALIDELKRQLRTPTTASLLRKALGILQIAALESKDHQGIVTIRGKGAADDSGIAISLRY